MDYNMRTCFLNFMIRCGVTNPRLRIPKISRGVRI